MSTVQGTVTPNSHLTPDQIIEMLSTPEGVAQYQEFIRTQSKNPQGPDLSAAEEKAERKREDEDSHPFPDNCLPPSLRRLADNISASTKMPAVIPYTAGLSTVSSSIGKGIMLETNPGEFVCGNTYILPVVDSGLGKSRSSKPMLSPLYVIHDLKQEEWKEKFREVKAELDELDTSIIAKKNELKNGKLTDAGRKKIKEELADLYERQELCEAENIRPELYTSNTTEPKLAKLLSENDEVISCVSSEAGAAIQILAGKYSSSNKNDVTTEDSLLLSAYCQERFKGDRLTTNCSDLKNPTVNLYWMFQSRYVPMVFGNHSLATGGFLARCLAFNSNAEPQELTGDEPEISDKLKADFYKPINVLFEEYRLKNSYEIVRTSKAAREAMKQYYNECIRLARGELRDIKQFPLRWCENAWKLALNLHAMAFEDESPKHELREITAMNAIQIMKWFSVEFLTLMNGGREDRLENDAQALVEYILRKGDTPKSGAQRSIKIRDICRGRSMIKADLLRIVDANPRMLHVDGDRVVAGKAVG